VQHELEIYWQTTPRVSNVLITEEATLWIMSEKKSTTKLAAQVRQKDKRQANNLCCAFIWNTTEQNCQQMQCNINAIIKHRSTISTFCRRQLLNLRQLLWNLRPSFLPPSPDCLHTWRKFIDTPSLDIYSNAYTGF